MSDYLTRLGKIDWGQALLNAMPAIPRSFVYYGKAAGDLARNNYSGAIDNSIEGATSALEMFPFGGPLGRVGGRIAGTMGKAALKKAALGKAAQGVKPKGR